jgi:hypothetical protein
LVERGVPQVHPLETRAGEVLLAELRHPDTVGRMRDVWLEGDAARDRTVGATRETQIGVVEVQEVGT